jgi:hypothetical protein
MSSLYVDTIRNKDGNGAPVFDRGIVISGIITSSGSLGGSSVGIGSTTVIDSSFQLKNILSLDSVTLSTFESALQIEPNNFTSLNIAGISTFVGNVFAQSNVNVTGTVGASRLAGVALSSSGTFYSIGVSTVSYLQGTHLDYSGISTLSHPRGINLEYTGISTLTNARGTSLYFSGISTADHLRSTTFNSSGVSTVTYLQGTNLNYSGISTIVSLSASSVTGTSLTATNANIPNLSASSITGTALTATSANITTLTINAAITTTSNVQTLNAVSVAATTLDGDSIVGLSATITNFAAQSATIAIGTATVFNPATLNATNVNTRNVSSVGVITSTEFHTGAAATSIRILYDRITGPSEIVIDPASTGSTGRVRIAGDLYVDGEQTYINSTAIELADFNVGIATTVATNSLLDGAGIGIGSTGIRKTITWNNSASALTSSEDWNLASGKQYEINGTSVLNSTTLGSAVVNSSLTSVGVLGQLNVTGITTSGTFSGQVNSGLATITTLTGTLLDYPSVFSRTGIITNSSGERLNYTGLSTVTNIRGTTLSYSGLSTITTLTGTLLDYPAVFSRTGIITNTSGERLNYTGLSTVSHARGTTLDYSGISTVTNVRGTTLSYSGLSTITTLTGTLLDYPSVFSTTGIITNTSGERLNYTGLSTVSHVRGTTLQYTGVSTVTTLTGTSLNYSGLSTITTLSGTSLDYPSVFSRTGIITNTSGERLNYTGLSTVTNIRGTTLQYTGVSTITSLSGTLAAYTTGSFTTGNVVTGVVTTLSGSLASYTTGNFTTGNVVTGVVTTLTSTNASLTNINSSGIATLTQLNVSGISTLTGSVSYGGLIFEKAGGEVLNTGTFPTGVTYSGITDTLTINLSQSGLPTVIAGDPSGQIDVIELTNAPTNGAYMTTLTLVIEGDAGGWDTGNVSITINGGAPTNLFWKNGAQPVGVTTSNPAYDIVALRIIRDSLGNFSVFADWDPYY